MPEDGEPPLREWRVHIASDTAPFFPRSDAHIARLEQRLERLVGGGRPHDGKSSLVDELEALRQHEDAASFARHVAVSGDQATDSALEPILGAAAGDEWHTHVAGSPLEDAAAGLEDPVPGGVPTHCAQRCMEWLIGRAPTRARQLLRVYKCVVAPVARCCCPCR
mmetsp:Transcript_27038/g.90501  ORF Transcript_27038/g.90501 Transcript_27038/m.90501 type:complete len:165 (+) Transcript_27038:146-640(+)